MNFRERRAEKESLLTVADVINILQYDPLTGFFHWKASLQGRVRRGDRAGGVRQGQRRIEIKGVRYVPGRLAWFVTHGRWPTHDIDHINGDQLDDRIGNLRDATVSQNMANRRRAKHNKSGVKGVRWSPKEQRWAADVRKGRRLVHQSYHRTIEDAKAAYARAAAIAHGEFARAD